MAEITWTSPAFLFLETLPQGIAFGIFRQIEMLKIYPRMGVPLSVRKKPYTSQLIYRKSYRITYEYDEAEDMVYISALQNCKQKLPSPRELRRQMPDEDE